MKDAFPGKIALWDWNRVQNERGALTEVSLYLFNVYSEKQTKVSLTMNVEVLDESSFVAILPTLVFFYKKNSVDLMWACLFVGFLDNSKKNKKVYFL